jgi:hypothetical protein
MLSLKFKRTAPSADTAPTTPSTVPVSLREWRTRAETPTAPPVQTLFSRESVPPQQTVAVWDPCGSWPGFSITQLALTAQGRISEISLMQEQGTDPVATLRSTVLPTPSGQSLGVVEVQASFVDDHSLRVALTLLEQTDRAVILAGANGDKDLIPRINDFVRADAWNGPSVLLVSPADKPSRADRLRRATWPRGMKMHVLELFSVNDPGWSQQLISLVTGFASGGPTVPDPVDDDAPAEAPPPPAPAPVAATAAKTAPPPEVSATVMHRVLQVLSMGVGVAACGVVAVEDARVLGVQAETQGQRTLLEGAAQAGCALWRAHGALGAGQPPLLELSWASPTHHHLALPVSRQPGLLLLACVEREFGDLGAVRWQMAVARNQWV